MSTGEVNMERCLSTGVLNMERCLSTGVLNMELCLSTGVLNMERCLSTGIYIHIGAEVTWSPVDWESGEGSKQSNCYKS